MQGAVVVAPLSPVDRAGWQRLAEGYKAFYATPTTPDDYDAAWARLMAGDAVHGLSAHLDGRLVGITHYLFHASTWAERVAYLQDLFTDREARGRGVARALIDAVADDPRALYDRVGEHRGFIRYDQPLRLIQLRGAGVMRSRPLGC